MRPGKVQTEPFLALKAGMPPPRYFSISYFHLFYIPNFPFFFSKDDNKNRHFLWQSSKMLYAFNNVDGVSITLNSNLDG